MDRACPHQNFTANVAVNRLASEEGGPVAGYSADITVNCADCREPFRWTGLQAGLSMYRPMCSIDETILVAPLRPASADPDFGLGLPGYAVGYVSGPARADAAPAPPAPATPAPAAGTPHTPPQHPDQAHPTGE
jgi:hypothetical protein